MTASCFTVVGLSDPLDCSEIKSLSLGCFSFAEVEVGLFEGKGGLGGGLVLVGGRGRGWFAGEADALTV